MSQEYFKFDKFISDLEERQLKKQESIKHQAELEQNNGTRRLNRLYREHHLAKTYVGDKND